SKGPCRRTARGSSTTRSRRGRRGGRSFSAKAPTRRRSTDGSPPRRAAGPRSDSRSAAPSYGNPQPHFSPAPPPRSRRLRRSRRTTCALSKRGAPLPREADEGDAESAKSTEARRAQVLPVRLLRDRAAAALRTPADQRDREPHRASRSGGGAADAIENRERVRGRSDEREAERVD